MLSVATSTPQHQLVTAAMQPWQRGKDTRTRNWCSQKANEERRPDTAFTGPNKKGEEIKLN